LGVLRAKLHLDLINIDFKIVAEYPDMVEENNSLYAKIEQMEKQD
jgi:hypothetical protein